MNTSDPNNKLDLKNLLGQIARDDNAAALAKAARTPFAAIAASAAIRTGNAKKVLRVIKSVNIAVDSLKKYEEDARIAGTTLHRELQKRIESKHD